MSGSTAPQVIRFEDVVKIAHGTAKALGSPEEIRKEISDTCPSHIAAQATGAERVELRVLRGNPFWSEELRRSIEHNLRAFRSQNGTPIQMTVALV